MPTSICIDSRFPNVVTTIFTTMPKMAAECGAVNLSQGFPSFQAEPALFDAMHRHMQVGRNQYVPMAGVPELRTAMVDKVAALYDTCFDVESEVMVTAGATQAIFTAQRVRAKGVKDIFIFRAAVSCISILFKTRNPLDQSPIAEPSGFRSEYSVFRAGRY